MAPPAATPAFELLNPDETGPVLLSVPHAGRDYPPDMRAKLGPPVERLLPLEDRMADELVRGLGGAPALIARTPRACIDLNRHEAEIDPGLVGGVIASRLMLTAKVRSGLGLVPRRLAGVGEIWRGRLDWADVEARTAVAHRPYHTALQGLIERALALHGSAVLLDIHSMPPLSGRNGRPPARIVIGNRFGQSAAPWTTARIAAVCERFGLEWTENAPYAGGYIIERHGRPSRGVHAVQVEVDRSLYLDKALVAIDRRGLTVIRALMAALVEAFGAAAAGSSLPLAAE